MSLNGTPNVLPAEAATDSLYPTIPEATVRALAGLPGVELVENAERSDRMLLDSWRLLANDLGIRPVGLPKLEILHVPW
ncbi:hypothetical protein [Mesorhizobium sp. WSM3626]|uniref:hypothetical protein n=1 Tax=Mesorhizobium sp. WSM3626 TaxID=1040987 RepID=UPI0004819276|nr:hypothetical protein [Mesorhizobium sp. WSM3626]